MRFEGLQLRIIGDIDRAHAGLAAVLTKWAGAEKQMRFQQDNLHSTKALFDAGETDRIALLGAELESAINERARLDVLVETQQSLNTLEDTLRYPIASALTTAAISNATIGKTP